MDDPMTDLPVWVDDDGAVRIGTEGAVRWKGNIFAESSLSATEAMAALRRVLPSSPDDGWTRDGDRWVRESSDVDELRAHHGRYGPGSVEIRSLEWSWCVASVSADIGAWIDVGRRIANGYRYRMVRPADPLPASDTPPEGLPADSLRIPDGWGYPPGSWLVPPDTDPVDGWQRGFGDGSVDPWNMSSLYYAAPVCPIPEPPATEDVPLAFVKGRQVLNGEQVFSAAQRDDGTWIYVPSSPAAGAYLDLPVNADGTVTVLRESDRGDR